MDEITKSAILAIGECLLSSMAPTLISLIQQRDNDSLKLVMQEMTEMSAFCRALDAGVKDKESEEFKRILEEEAERTQCRIDQLVDMEEQLSLGLIKGKFVGEL